MADMANAHQRTLYQKKFCNLSYLDGRGNDYETQLRRLSWPVSADLPSHAQESAQYLMPHSYNTLHPMQFTTTKEEYYDSFANATGSFGVHVDTNKKTEPVHMRLFAPTRGVVPGCQLKYPVTEAEMMADKAFGAGKYDLAVRGYTNAISQKASLYCYEKRCAALAHIGRYQEALADAKFVLSNGPQGEAESGPNKSRVKAIETFLAKKIIAPKGFQEAPATLMCVLTPKDFRGWRSPTPSTYTRPYPFGSGVATGVGLQASMSLTGGGEESAYATRAPADMSLKASM